MEPLSRRYFLQGSLVMAGLGLLTGCGIPVVPGQQAAKVPRIGFLAPGSRESQAMTIDGLLRALGELGYADGQTMAVEYRFGTEAQLPERAAELVRLNVDLILSHGTPAGLAAKHATGTIPVVIYSSDPVGVGLVDSLARPGGNVTGMTNYLPQMTGKQLQLLLEVVPAASHIAYLVNPDNPTSVPQERALQDAAGPSIRLVRLEARTPAQIEAGFRTVAAERAEGLVVLADSLIIGQQRGQIVEFALSSRVPTMFPDQRAVPLGGLMGYGANVAEEFRGRARYVDRILKGARPADLPVEGPTKFDFFINLKTAQALGLTIPPSVLQQATEIIQ
jgi:putative ABC transport system substrate-binding protein